MSLRWRTLSLIAGLVVLSSALTGWLITWNASQQVVDTVIADREQTLTITARLAEYGLTHGGWYGVDATVRSLSASTGQRIRLETSAGEMLADSDVDPRPVAGAAAVVNPRPQLRWPAGVSGFDQQRSYFQRSFARHRMGLMFAACLTRAGTGVRLSWSAEALPVWTPVDGRANAIAGCADDLDAAVIKQDLIGAGSQADRCRSADSRCLGQVFDRGLGHVGAATAQVYVGAVNERPAALAIGPSAALAAAVAACCVGGALLLTRRTLRSVQVLTSAAARLAAGDRSHRVPVRGRDEIADLARSFNTMIESVQHSEARQRQLAADVSHELRTPLANLRGYLEAIQDGVIEATPAVIASLHEEAMLQQRILDDLHELAIAESGDLRYHWTDVDVAEVIDTVAAGQTVRAGVGGVELCVWPTPSLPPVHADRDRLRQVLANLIVNAIQATPRGGLVTISAQLDDECLAIVVSDTGVGISADDLPRVFDRMWRPDASRSRSTGGSGLGLAIARQIMRDHGGWLDASSTPGVGSEFRATLPVQAD